MNEWIDLGMNTWNNSWIDGAMDELMNPQLHAHTNTCMESLVDR